MQLAKKSATAAERRHMDREAWRDVPGYGGHYQASSLGRIRSKARCVRKRHRSGKVITQHYKQRILSPSRADEWGHLSVSLGFDGKTFSASVHKLVLLAFVGPRPDGTECCHCNGVAWDNRPENLRWDTHANNNGDRVKHNTYAIGDRHPMAKFPDSLIVEVSEYLRRGGSGVDASRIFGISESHVSRIKKGQHGAVRNPLEGAGA